MLYEHIKIEGLKGVGTVELKLDQDQSVCVLIGENGVGKTKTLEALFQALWISHESSMKLNRNKWPNNEVFSKATIDKQEYCFKEDTCIVPKYNIGHHFAIVFLASQNRGFVHHEKGGAIQSIGSFEQRQKSYFSQLVSGMNETFSSLNMNVDIEQWFVTIAQSSNPYQKKSDNREVELHIILKLLNQINDRIDPNPNSVEISGDNRVSLTIEGQKRELSHLSTGFASILKIIQSIVSGYGYFTNENQLQNVPGVVLIDEIESHMHLSWQAKIVPLLKQLFPNTTFYITTHSSIVLSQLKTGEAYRLQRDPDGVVRNQAITAPNKAAFIDVLKDAFDIDLNQMKIDRANPADQAMAKRQLLALIQNEGA